MTRPSGLIYKPQIARYTVVCHTCKKEFKAKLERAKWCSNLCKVRTTRNSRKWMLKYDYGLSLEQYDQMYQDQCGQCKICNKVVQTLVVDHNHITNQVRGLLCANCNSGLGMFHDDYNVVKRAVEYLTHVK